MDNGNFSVYKHTSPNGKIYIGITSKNPLKRWKNGNGYRGNQHFWRAIVKYGWDNFKHEILFSGLTKNEACEKEIALIAKYKSNDQKYGYNHAIGGEINQGFHFTLSEENKRMISARMIGNNNAGDQSGKNNHFYGHHHSKTAREKISAAQYNPVLQYDKDGNFIAEYANAYQAELQTNILHILECCKHKRKSAGGYYWKFKIKEKELELRREIADRDAW